MRRVSWPWLVVSGCLVLGIWGASMVPGVQSDALSHTALYGVQGFLASLGLPVQWLSNFIIRKMAHALEYAALGFTMARGLDPEASGVRERLVPLVALLVLAPSVDETIQLFVPGRSGMMTDVVLDCCGAAVGVALSYAWGRAVWKKRGEK